MMRKMIKIRRKDKSLWSKLRQNLDIQKIKFKIEKRM